MITHKFLCSIIAIMILALIVEARLNIPQHFAGLTFLEKPNGQVEIQTHENIYIFDYGESQKFNITTLNLTSTTKSEGGTLANLTKYDTNLTFGNNKNDFVANWDLNESNKTVKRRLGKEFSFIDALVGLFSFWNRRRN